MMRWLSVLVMAWSVAIGVPFAQAVTQYDGDMRVTTRAGHIVGDLQVEMDPAAGAMRGTLGVCCPDPALAGDYVLRGGIKPRGLTLRDRRHGVAIFVDPHTLHGTITFLRRAKRPRAAGTVVFRATAIGAAPEAYTAQCAVCHGATAGGGLGGLAPNIQCRKNITGVVRQGAGLMPAFPASVVTTADIAAMELWLAGFCATTTTTTATTVPTTTQAPTSTTVTSTTQPGVTTLPATTTTVTTTTSAPTTTVPVCGNGIVEVDESCDPPGAYVCQCGFASRRRFRCTGQCRCPQEQVDTTTTESTTTTQPPTTSTTTTTTLASTSTTATTTVPTTTTPPTTETSTTWTTSTAPPTTETTTTESSTTTGASTTTLPSTTTTSPTTTEPTTTTTTLPPSVCGDGQVTGAEVCDPPGAFVCPCDPAVDPLGLSHLACQPDCTCPDWVEVAP
jgi:hypothetical protein